MEYKKFSDELPDLNSAIKIKDPDNVPESCYECEKQGKKVFVFTFLGKKEDDNNYVVVQCKRCKRKIILREEYKWKNFDLKFLKQG